MKVSVALTKARALLKSTGHCKGEFARNKYRHSINPTNPNAVRFCAYGAIMNVLGVKDSRYDKEGIREADRISDYLRDVIPADPNHYFRTVDSYNDDKATTPKDVDRWFSRAIKLAKINGD